MQIIGQDVFRRIKVDHVHGSSVSKVASQFVHVYLDDNVEHIADSFSSNPEVLAIGVCDSSDKLLGIIDRTELFQRLGRPFGRDILSRKTAREISEESKTFLFSSNVFSVAEELKPYTQDRERIRYFGISDEQMHFRGLFSTIDILNFLSTITQNDIQLAGQLQTRMLSPTINLKADNCQFCGFSRSAKGIGGDFCHVQKIGKNHIFFTVCDVSGKGAAASIITGMLWGMLRVYDWKKGLSNLIREINISLIQSFHLEKYLTGVFGIYNQSTRELLLADMGHSHSFIIRGDKIRHINTNKKNLPVGITLDLDPVMIRSHLHQSDILACITDGLLEQENRAGNFKPATEWFKPLLAYPFENWCCRLEENFAAFTDTTTQQDDISALFLKVEQSPIQENQAI